MKDSFILYTEHGELIEQLSDSQAGELLKSLFTYTKTGEVPELDAMCRLVFTSIRQDLDRNAQKYEEKCEKMRQNGLKGGRGKCKYRDKSEDLPQGKQTEPLQQDIQNETHEEISSNNEDLNLQPNNLQTNLPQNNLPQTNLPQNNLPHTNLPPHKAIAFSENQMVFSESKKSFYDNVNDNENENDNDNENENVLSLSKEEKISKEEREIIENYVRKNKLANKSVSAYTAKLIANGDYKQILAKAKKKSVSKKSRKEQIRMELAAIHDKRSAAKVLAPYYNRGEPPAEFEEIMKKYDLDTFDKAEKYTHELWLEAQKLRAP